MSPLESWLCHFKFGGKTSSKSLSVLVCRMMIQIKRRFRGLFWNKGLRDVHTVASQDLTFEDSSTCSELSEEGHVAYRGGMGLMGLEPDSQACGHRHETFSSHQILSTECFGVVPWVPSSKRLVGICA